MRKKIFFLKGARLLIVVMATILSVIFLSACSNNQEDVNKKVHSYIKGIQQSIDHSEALVSSNPYDFVKNNEDYDALINLGVAALPELKQMLEDSNQDGLIEYIYAIAIEQLSKVDMRQETDWSTGKEFLLIYSAYLKEIPNKVESIVNEPIEDMEKIDQLKALGTPAIPYIFNAIENGHQELSPALDYLTDNKSKEDIGEWSVEHVDQLNLLINFVEK